MSSHRFQWTRDSKYNEKSEVQHDAMNAIENAIENTPVGSSVEKRGSICILPCGSGKSSLMVEGAMKKVAKARDGGSVNCLFLCYEKQGVIQLSTLLRDHTTLLSSFVCVVSGEVKNVPNHLACYAVMTYGMYVSLTIPRAGRTSEIGKFLKKTHWNIVMADEVHHSTAATYKPALEELKNNSQQIMGFTGTLFRSESDRAGNESREAHEERLFGWLGHVIFRRTCRELENCGLIAKIRRLTILTPFIDEFEVAYPLVSGAMHQYLHSAHPSKLNALSHLCEIHKAMGHTGIVFANHLFVAKIVQRILGQRWEILSGSNSHGEDELHTAEQNAKIIAKFNAGELDGLVSTAVGESSLDIYVSTFCYLIVVDAHSGEAAAAQRLGRLTRSFPVKRRPGQSDASLQTERIARQKSGFYYELVTPNTEEEVAARAREAKFDSEGYARGAWFAHERLMSMAGTASRDPNSVPLQRLPFKNLRDSMVLLAETLSYDELGKQSVKGKVAAAEVRAPHRKLISTKRNHAKESTSVFKARYVRQVQVLSQKTATVKAAAKEANRTIIDATELPSAAREIFDKLNLSNELIAELISTFEHARA